MKREHHHLHPNPRDPSSSSMPTPPPPSSAPQQPTSTAAGTYSGYSIPNGTTSAGKSKLWDEYAAVDGGMDELLAVVGYKVRSSDMAEVAQKLEQLEEAMGNRTGRNLPTLQRYCSHHRRYLQLARNHDQQSRLAASSSSFAAVTLR
ncbi:hypothetical protein PIB30_014274 [Stylosanthes scabra]|uniref:Transcriptional factor DELLA N-terminal domain-containing protein n=1 Tax=Stylosanthes scabra TaxID=79078 RepID=A0ABU6Z515_9FABA|nr:hypothetical protein [Stylosanthes scabra]